MRPAAVLAAMLVVACGGEPAQDAAEREAVERALYEQVGSAPPELVAAPEGEAGHAGAGDAEADRADADRAAIDRAGTATEGGSGAEPAPTSSGAGEQAATTDAILRATARTYEGVRSLRAEFEQRMRNPLLGRETVSSGTLYQRQPDRFLMEFSDPEGDIIVSDGEFFWLYYPSVDARQVIRAPRGPQGLDLHSQFIGDPVRRFQATFHGREDVRGRAAHVLTLVPRDPLGYRSLKVWIDVDDHLVRRFELTEENGNVRHFELRDVVVNPSLPDRLFQFTPPAGAQVIQRG